MILSDGGGSYDYDNDYNSDDIKLMIKIMLIIYGC